MRLFETLFYNKTSVPDTSAPRPSQVVKWRVKRHVLWSFGTIIQRMVSCLSLRILAFLTWLAEPLPDIRQPNLAYLMYQILETGQKVDAGRRDMYTSDRSENGGNTNTSRVVKRCIPPYICYRCSIRSLILIILSYLFPRSHLSPFSKSV